jgi:hypothetical protein
MLSVVGFRATAVHAVRRNSFTADILPTTHTYAPRDMLDFPSTRNNHSSR